MRETKIKINSKIKVEIIENFAGGVNIFLNKQCLVTTNAEGKIRTKGGRLI